ncbi:tetratricopeptide repeat protein [Methylopila sp. M107]|uniref:SEL1-like repeat protein n=1 Tax=Methylopila sp. M107 TaxID=1101190 RepID=UPI00036AC0A0|nr:tetratricopeptide repeat protein [Methylopila sp. M107]
MARPFAASLWLLTVVLLTPAPAGAQDAGRESSPAPATDCDRLSGMPVDRDWLDLDSPGPVYTLGQTRDEVEAIVAACRAAADQHPDEKRFPFRLGLALKDAGRIDEALAAFAAARRLGSVGGYDEAGSLLLFGSGDDPTWKGADPKAAAALLDEGVARFGPGPGSRMLRSTRAYGRRLDENREEAQRGEADLKALGDEGSVWALVMLARSWLGKSPELDAAAIGNLRKAIELGGGDAAYRLGNTLRGKDDEEMIRLYRLAVSRGSAEGMNALGYAYEYGIGVPKVGSLAVDNYEMAARRGHVVAQANLGGLYASGDLLPVDYAKARRWLEIATERGGRTAPMSLGMLYDWGRGVPVDLAKARSLYEIGASRGDAGAMNNMGYLFEHGRGAEVDLAKAREWYEKAAEAGSTDAASNLAEMYRHGVGVPKDQNKALALSMRSASNATGLNNLAMAHLRGEGVEKDPTTARALFAEAEALGSAEAAHNLAGMIEGGEGGERDNDEARRLFRKSAQAGFPNGMYRYGNRVRLDADTSDENAYRAAMFEARNWLARAVEAGDPHGVSALAGMIANGEGGPANPAEALRLYRIAAKDDVEARLELAGRLRTGDGVPADPAEARRIFGEAASPEAWTAYLEMVDRGEGGPKDPKAGTESLREKIRLGEFRLVGLLAKRIDEGAGALPDPAAARRMLAERLRLPFPLDLQPDAALMLGRMFEDGRGGPVDREGAIRAYRKAAERLEPEAMTRLAAILRRRGIPAEKVEARRLLERAGLRGGGMAFRNLFEMLDRGEGGPAAPEQAAILLRTALVVHAEPEALALAARPEKRVSAATRREFVKLMEEHGHGAPKGADRSGPLVSAETLAELAARPALPDDGAARKPGEPNL